METFKKKRPTRGRKPKRKKWKTPHEALLGELIIAFGGPTNLADHVNEKAKTNFERQHFDNWRKRGGVPIECCPLIAAGLDMPQQSFNETLWVIMKKAPSWGEIVKGCKWFDEEAKKIVLALGEKYGFGIA